MTLWNGMGAGAERANCNAARIRHQRNQRDQHHYHTPKCHLQKYAAKGSLNARISARLTEGAAVKIGYARVSTQDQNLDLQLKALKKAGCQKIFREKLSGFNRQRPEFQRMLDQIRPGDIIVVWKLDRLARSTRDLLNTMETINEAGGKSSRYRNLGPTPQHTQAR